MPSRSGARLGLARLSVAGQCRRRSCRGAAFARAPSIDKTHVTYVRARYRGNDATPERERQGRPQSRSRPLPPVGYRRNFRGEQQLARNEKNETKEEGD